MRRENQQPQNKNNSGRIYKQCMKNNNMKNNNINNNNINNNNNNKNNNNNNDNNNNYIYIYYNFKQEKIIERQIVKLKLDALCVGSKI